MLLAKYDFFLDEMIRLHNIQLVENLQATGQYPHNSVLRIGPNQDFIYTFQSL
jgi:hypothetical protein